MLIPGSTCRLQLGCCTVDHEHSPPVAVIDGTQSQSFVMLDGGFSQQDSGEIVYRHPDQWTLRLFKQLVARLRRNQQNDINGILFDSLRKLKNSGDQNVQGSATFIVGSTLPRLMGTDKFIVLGITSLFDGAAIHLRPSGPKVNVDFANLDDEGAFFSRVKQQENSTPDALALKIEKLKSRILLYQIRRQRWEKEISKMEMKLQPDLANELLMNKRRLAQLGLATDLDKEKLEELEFQKTLFGSPEPCLRLECIIQHLSALDRKITTCSIRLILDSVVNKVLYKEAKANRPRENFGSRKKLSLLESYFDIWFNSKEINGFRHEQETSEIVSSSLKFVTQNAMAIVFPTKDVDWLNRAETQSEQAAVKSDIYIADSDKSAAFESEERCASRSKPLAWRMADLAYQPDSRSEYLPGRLGEVAGESPFENQTRREEEAGFYHPTRLEQDTPASSEDSRQLLDQQTPHPDKAVPLQGKVTHAPPEPENDIELLKSLLEESYGEAATDAPLVRGLSSSRRVSHYGYDDNYETLYAELSDDIQHDIFEKEPNKGFRKIVRFSAYAEIIGESGWSVGISKLKIDESRRRAYKPTERFPYKIPLTYEVVTKTHRLTSGLIKRGLWYPDIRTFYDETEDWIMGRNTKKNHVGETHNGFLWQLMSLRRESCPPELYQKYNWTLYPRDIVVIGNHSLWNSITDKGLAQIVNQNYEYDPSIIARSVADLAIRRRFEFPHLANDRGSVCCIVCKVAVQSLTTEPTRERATKSCAII